MADNKFLRDCIEWDVVNWSKALMFWDQTLDLENRDLRCLELGGRRGGISLWLASKGNYVICSDYHNPEMIAAQLHRRYPFSERIIYQAIDATNIPYQNHFDIIAFKSILGGISRNGKKHLVQLTIDQIWKALKPGGYLLFAENLEASALHRFLRKKMTAWGSYWNYLRIEDMPSLLRGFESVDYQTAGFLGAFGRTEFQRRLLGKIDTALVERIVDNKMKYIIFGVAKKPMTTDMAGGALKN